MWPDWSHCAYHSQSKAIVLAFGSFTVLKIAIWDRNTSSLWQVWHCHCNTTTTITTTTTTTTTIATAAAKIDNSKRKFPPFFRRISVKKETCVTTKLCWWKCWNCGNERRTDFYFRKRWITRRNGKKSVKKKLARTSALCERCMGSRHRRPIRILTSTGLCVDLHPLTLHLKAPALTTFAPPASGRWWPSLVVTWPKSRPTSVWTCSFWRARFAHTVYSPGTEHSHLWWIKRVTGTKTWTAWNCTSSHSSFSR